MGAVDWHGCCGRCLQKDEETSPKAWLRLADMTDIGGLVGLHMHVDTGGWVVSGGVMSWAKSCPQHVGLSASERRDSYLAYLEP
jgi:hypothetical protein